MSGSASLALEQGILQHTLGIAALAFPARVYVALCVNGLPPSESVGGVEAFGGSYARVAATFALLASPSNIAANAASVEFPLATAAWGELGYFEIWTAQTGGSRLYWGGLVDPVSGNATTLDVAAGDIVRFSAGTLAVEVAGPTTVAAPSGVSSFNTRVGAVVLSNSDVVAVLPPSANPGLPNGVAAAGTSAMWARGDHVHPGDASSVLNYGADPTGVADSTPAIRAALAVRPAQSVYLPSGSYRITDSLTVGAGNVSQTLYGDGQSSILLVNTDFNPSALGVIILAGRQTQLATHPVVQHLTIQFAVPPDLTATLASAVGTTLTLTAAVPAGVVVGDYVTDDTDWSGIQTNSTTMNTLTPIEGSKVVSIAGSTLTISLPVVTAHIAAGHVIRFGHTRSMFRNLGAAPPPSTGVGGYGAKYPWAIYATNCGLPLIQNIKVNGAWNGIYMHPANEGGSFRIKDCPIGAMNVGVDIDEGADGGFMENVWFNAYGIYVPAFLTNTCFGQVWYDGQTVAWSIGKTDGIFMLNIGVLNCNSEIKPTWSFGQIVNMDQDFPSAHFNIGAHAGLLQITNFRGQKVIMNGGATFSNCTIDGSASAAPFLDINGPQPTFDQCSIVAPVPGGVVVRSGATPHLRGCIITGPASNWSGGLIQTQAGAAISMHGCEFVSVGAGPGLTMAGDSQWSNVGDNFWGNSTFTPPGQAGKYQPGLPPQQGGVAAAGTTQATATPLVAYYSNVNTVPSAGNGVILPNWAPLGSRWTVWNRSGNAMNVWPPVGYDIGGGLNTAVSLAGGANTRGTWIAWDSGVFLREV